MTTSVETRNLTGPAAVQAQVQSPQPARFWRRLEDLAVSITLAAMVVIPIVEAVLRGTLQTGITAAALIVQHLALIAGMLGGMIAAREGRLLLLSTLGENVLKGRARTAALVFTGAVGGAVAAFLAFASYQFVQSEQRFGKILVYGIPIWAIELALPIGFAVIAGRLVYRASPTWRGRLVALAAAVAAAAVAVTIPDGSMRLAVP